MVKFLIHRPKWIVVLVGACVFWLVQKEWLTDSRVWQKAEGVFIDRRYLLRGEDLPDPAVRLVGLGSSSFKLDTLSPEEIAASPTLQQMQQPWPWDRSVYTAILEKLMDAGAKVVMFDFVFASQTDGDDVFAQALAKYKDRVVIGEMFADEKDSGGNTKKLTKPNERLLLPGTESIVGLVNIWPDGDDTIRRARYQTSEGRETSEMPRIDPRIVAFLKRQIATGKMPDNLKHITARAAEKFKGKILTPPPEVKTFIDFQGAPGTYRPLPVENMFAPELWKKPPFENGQVFRDKLVVVGPMAEIFHDVHATPFGEMPGPELQAQMLAALLHGSWLTETSPDVNFALTCGAVMLALLICLGIPQAWLKGLSLTAVGAAFLIGCQLVFNHRGLVVPMMPFLFCFIITGMFGILFEYAMEQLERRHYRNVLDRYVSTNVAKTILADRRSFTEALKGRKLPVTVLFSDIRGFTAMTENSDAEKLVDQLNEYFAEMVGSVLEHDGTLQKFIGDAIMAVWGDTHSEGVTNDARRAVTAALQMRAALARLNGGWWERSDRTGLAIGIGVNHGEVIVGNIGHPRRMEFTVLGDSVNLAARLESATKQFKTDILIGEETEKLTRGDFVYRKVGALAFKGKTRPVETFLVLGDRSQSPPDWLEKYHEAVRLYRAKQFTAAIELFEKVKAEIGQPDHLCEMYITSCMTLNLIPPPLGWDGSFSLSEK